MKYDLDPQLRKYVISISFTAEVLRARREVPQPYPDFAGDPNISVSETFAGELPLRVYTPAGLSPDAPSLLYFHGGGFGFREAPHHRLLAARLALAADCRVVCPDFRLLPEHPYPAARQDGLTAYRWLCAAHPGARLAVAGDSAGGTLAAYTLHDAAANGLPGFCLLMLLYPVLDAEMTCGSMERLADAHIWSAKNNRDMWHMYLGGADREQASPMHLPLPPHVPDAYIETAEFDCLRDEGAAYARRLSGAGAQVELVETKGTPHGYDVAADSSIVRDCMARRAAALRRAFGAQP